MRFIYLMLLDTYQALLRACSVRALMAQDLNTIKCRQEKPKGKKHSIWEAEGGGSGIHGGPQLFSAPRSASHMRRCLIKRHKADVETYSYNSSP